MPQFIQITQSVVAALHTSCDKMSHCILVYKALFLSDSKDLSEKLAHMWSWFSLLPFHLGRTRKGCTLPHPPGQDQDRMYPTPTPPGQDQDRMYPTPPPGQDQDRIYPTLLFQAGPGQDVPYPIPLGRTRTGCTLPHPPGQDQDGLMQGKNSFQLASSIVSYCTVLSSFILHPSF